MPNAQRRHWRSSLQNTKNKRLVLAFIVFDILIALGVLGWFAWAQTHPQPAPRFDGERALKDVTAQVAFGPRIPNSDAHAKAVEYIQSELAAAGWQLCNANINARK